MNLLNSTMFFNRDRIKKTKSGKIFVLLIFGPIMISLGLLFFVQQAESARIALTPLVFELMGEKGKTAEEYVRVMNPSYEDTITVVMEVEDMFPEGEEGRIRLEVPLEERDPFSLSSWITFEPEKFILDPREEKPIKFIINIPEYAEPGGHYASILAKTEIVEGPAGVGVGIVQRIASLVLLTVPGEMKEEISIVGFETSKNYYEYGPIKFAVRFENIGTVHLKPEAMITITNFLGQKVAEVPIESRNVLPGAVRRLEQEWSQKWLWPGKYTATLTGTYGRANFQLDPKSITFWAFSWKIGLLLILILVFFIITRKRWIKALKILIKGEAALSRETKSKK